MRTIAVPVDDEIYVKAEKRATALDTSVQAVVASYLRDWATEGEHTDAARQTLKARFAQRDWQFSVGAPDNRTQRNARR